MQYLLSALKTSLTKNWIGEQKVNNIKFGVGVGLIVYFTVLAMAEVIAFPGYYEPDGSRAYF